MNGKFDFWKRFSAYYLLMYLLMMLCTALFFFEVREWSAATALLLLTALPVYSLGYVAPGMLISLLLAVILRKKKCRAAVAAVSAGACSALAQMIVLADFGLFRGFGFHFNMFVWNLVTTPGGFASMGLRSDTILPLAAAIILICAFNALMVWGVGFWRGGRIGLAVYRILAGWRKYALIAFVAVCGFVNPVVFAWNHYVKNSTPLLAAERIPAYQRATMRDIFRKLKFKEPKRDELLMRIGKSKSIRYPLAPIRRRAERKRFNVVWLTCESWRADMLGPEVMPNACRFADKYAVSFKDNHSGGNGTRQGMFSMFYGLYGSYWHSFLSGRTGAQIIDWMINDNYDFGCFTSAKFSYPEFDQTIFAKLPAGALHSFDRDVTYKRDIRNTKQLIDFITSDHGGKPFMAFMFFESPHYPYEFPPENAKFKDFAAKVNYLDQLGKEHAEKIRNRYRNSCFTLDGFLGQVFAVLEERKLLDDTIVVVVGDHGEEFFEHGRLGHNSDFTREQIRTPLLLHIPGVQPGVYTGMSSHVDIVAMLAPHFGVENDPADFCLGKNLIGPGAPVRDYAVIAGWSTIFFVGKKYKMVLPLNSFDAVTMKLYDAMDNPLPDPQVFFREYRNELVEVQKDMRRFY